MTSVGLPVLTAGEMRDVDARATRDFGVPVALLMERAGAGALAAMERHFGDLHGFRIAVVCGRGHNGGDGFVLARRLAERGADVRTALVTARDALEGVVAEKARDLVERGGPLDEQATPEAIEGFLAATRWDFVVDALLGTGSRGAPAGVFAAAVRAIGAARARGARVVALDFPTGLDADTGASHDPCVEADLTVTFAALKRAHVLYPGRRRCGAIEVADIGIPDGAVDAVRPAVELLSPEGAAALLPARPETAHKGTVGRGLLIGGSPGLSGAVFLAAQSAVAAGIGLVTVAIPRGLCAAAQARLAEPVSLATEETDAGTISRRALPALVERARGVRALAIGPGLGRHAEASELVLGLLASAAAPRVIDADGLTALAEARDWGAKAGASTVLTPHLGEMARLTGEEADALEARRIDAALEWAKRWGVVVVLKGAPTVTASPDGRCTVNPSGNPGMASAGMGDVLTGAVLAFLAQGVAAYDAARLAVYVHGRAGDRVALRHGVALAPAGLVAAEIPETLGELAILAGRPPLPPPLPSRPIVPRPD